MQTISKGITQQLEHYGESSNLQATASKSASSVEVKSCFDLAGFKVVSREVSDQPQCEEVVKNDK